MDESAVVCESWVSLHIFYHEDLDRLALGLVPAIVESLSQSRYIDSFFFIRYKLGGPHLRLRLHALPGLRQHVIDTASEAAREFLAREPSRASMPEEAIRQLNQAILAKDPHESDDAVYPDNSLRIFPFNPEIQRYGGPALYGRSLELFAVSSSVALGLLKLQTGRPRSAQLVDMFCLLLRQLLGFALDEEELLDLPQYGAATWGEIYPKAMEKGKDVFQARREMFLGLLKREAISALSALCPLGQASRRLSHALRDQETQIRRAIGVSQLHMTANRLGLSNPEEVYIGSLLSATLKAGVDGRDEILTQLMACA